VGRTRDRDAVKFLARCKTVSVKLENGPAYLRKRIAEKKPKELANALIGQEGAARTDQS